MIVPVLLIYSFFNRFYYNAKPIYILQNKSLLNLAKVLNIIEMKYNLVKEFIMSKVVVPENCFFQGCYNPEFETEIEKCKNKCFEYNKLNPNDREAQTKTLKTLL